VPTWPDIDYRGGIADIYRSIAVNINITSCQMPTAVNQRVFDIPLCNGFVINDTQSDLDELFAPDEIVVYKSKEELISKIAFYRARETERRAVTQKTRARILSEHTYAHRVDAIGKILP
jgi:spore maturation protein CgeB